MMRISLFDKLKGNSLNINGNIVNSNLDFYLPDYSGNIQTTLESTIDIYVTTTPNRSNEFRTIQDALHYAARYRGLGNGWIRIKIKSGYVIEHSTHIENMAFHRVIIESEDDVVMVNVDQIIQEPNPLPTYSNFKSVIGAYNCSTLPTINFSMKANKTNSYLSAVTIRNGSTGRIWSGNTFDGFSIGVRVSQASLGTMHGIIIKNAISGLSVDDCSLCFCHNMTIENCEIGISSEQMAMIDAFSTNFKYGEKSKHILLSQFSSSTYLGSSVVTNWTRSDEPLILVLRLSHVMAIDIVTTTSPGIRFSNIDVNQYTPNGYIIK